MTWKEKWELSSPDKRVYGGPSGRTGGSEIRHGRESARHTYSHCVGVCERSSPPGRQASFETGTEKEQVIFQNIT